MYVIGDHWCGGRLVIVKNIETGKLFLLCEECYVWYSSLENALKDKNGTRKNCPLYELATLKDIQEQNWKVNNLDYFEGDTLSIFKNL